MTKKYKLLLQVWKHKYILKWLDLTIKQTKVSEKGM